MEVPEKFSANMKLREKQDRIEKQARDRLREMKDSGEDIGTDEDTELSDLGQQFDNTDAEIRRNIRKRLGIPEQPRDTRDILPEEDFDESGDGLEDEPESEEG